MARFQLAHTAFVCVQPRGTVILDVARDAYLGLDVRQSQALSGLVVGWPASGTAGAVPDAAAHELAASLAARGILVETPQGKPVQLSALPASEELIPWEDMRGVRVRVTHVLHFLRALVTAVILLRLCSLQAAVRRVQARAGRAPDITQMRRLLTIYTLIRLFVFARRGRCLLDSLVLIEFLAGYGLTPHWVIGVQVRPFAAHSWVQAGHCVLNGTVPFVRSYQPILVI